MLAVLVDERVNASDGFKLIYYVDDLYLIVEARRRPGIRYHVNDIRKLVAWAI